MPAPFAARIAAGRPRPFLFCTNDFHIPVTQASPTKTHDTQALDTLTGGAFTAPTSGERAARVRDWLAGNPSPEQMQEVFRELSGRDKGAARVLRERLDEIKRSKGQEAIAAEWAEKARALIAPPKINVADALGWQRDAARAGAPLSKEPLASLKAALADRVKGIEDLQHRVQVQREAAVLLAQRIEVLSTKSWRDAQASAASLQTDVPDWQGQAKALQADANWASVDTRFPPLLEASRSQLQAVWDAFRSALSQAEAAAADPHAPLPPVPVWSDEFRQARGLPAEASPKPAARPRVDPEVRAKASDAVREVLARLEQEIAQGHGKASAGAASALRNALKEHGRLVDDKLESQAQAALGAAGELEGWQRWRADQLRQELVAKAEALFERVAPMERPAPAEGQAPVEGEEPAAAPQEPPAPVRKPRYGGRKMQEHLRALREQWKQTDQGGPPNHALWKRFDEACNEAHKVVESWLEKVKADAAEHRNQRLALIEELKAWGADNLTARDGDWKGFNRVLHQFSDRWRDAGHLSEKAFAEIQPQWKAAMELADAPLTAARNASLARRKAMIEEAQVLGAEPVLHIDAVKHLQQRWQHEAQGVPIERKQEQKLWDAFRKPIDDAFQRKTVEREKAASALGEFDRMVLEASKAVEAATASGDAQQIHAAAKALEAIVRGQVPVPAAAPAPVSPAANPDAAAASVEAASPPSVEAALAATDDPHAASESNQAAAQESPAQAATENVAEQASPASDSSAFEAATDAAETAFEEASEPATAPAEPPPAPKAAPKPVIARRGDDRPGAKRVEAAPAGRGGKFGDRKDSRPGSKPGGARQSTDNKFEPYRPEREDRGDRAPRFSDRNERPAFEERGPRLGDAAFRAQREAFEAANMALKKLQMQAHGEVLTNLLTAWEKRDAAQVPSAQDLGKLVSPAVRSSWVEAVTKPSGQNPSVASESLLRLEMAAEVPTPAEHISARRMLQLQLLTKRNAPAPAETWGEDAAIVLAGDFEAGNARRVQTVLKVLLKR